MRYLFFIALFSGLLIQGCSNENTLGPDYNSSSTVSKTWIDAFSAIQLEKSVTVLKEINGETGGLVEYDFRVGNVNVLGSLTIPENSFDGLLDLSVSFSNRTTTQTFGPSPLNFNVPLILDLEYRGVNFKTSDYESIDFYYIDGSGEMQKAEYTSIEVDASQGLLKVSGAKINHFSRYGWAK